MPSGGADLMPLFVAGVAALCMAAFEFLIQKKNYLVLENFSLAASMLVAMTAAVLVNMVM
jgi:cell shape-determining protein MreD